MSGLNLFWLGPPLVEQNGDTVKLETRKSLALLAYLSLEKKRIPREVLATLFWPEYDQQHAMANLRRALTSLSDRLKGDWIAADRETIGLRNQLDYTDVDEYLKLMNFFESHSHGNENLCQDCIDALQKAIKLYRGDFLQGFNLRDCPVFDDWQFFTREDLRNKLALILERLVKAYVMRGNYDLAIQHARHWVFLDRLHEPAQRQLIRAYALAGQRSAAARQYDELVQLLQEELGQPPEDETTQVYQQIQSGSLSGKSVQSARLYTAPSDDKQVASSKVYEEPILQAKLCIPYLHINLVQRSRLFTLLDTCTKGSLTLVSAPAGFGKSTLLAGWARQTSQPVAWLSLDTDDDDPYRFLKYLIAAIERIHAGVRYGATEMLYDSPQLPIQTILRTFISDIDAREDPFILVLDDYQFVSAEQIHSGVAYLLDHLPANMHLVLSSRADPPLQLSRLRGRGQLCEIRANDLRFTLEESCQFFNQIMKLGIPIEEIDILEERTEGWVVGLQMAALSLQGRQDSSQFIQTFSGSHRYILDYLVEEVLSLQPKSIQSFLLRTSILDRMCATLCDQLLESEDQSSQEILEYLDRSNLFVIPLDETRQWYRYHHLFAELLRSRLNDYMAKHQSEIQALHIRAANWFDERGLYSESIDHALASRDFLVAAELIEKNMLNILSQSRLTLGLRWLKKLPEVVIHERPWLCVQKARLLCLLGKLEEVDSLLHRAELTIRDGPPSMDTEKLAAHIAMVRANQAFFQDDVPGTIQYSRQALEFLPEDQFIFRFMSLLLLGHGCFISGDTEGEENVWQAASLMMAKYPEIPLSFKVVLGHAHGYHLFVQGRLTESYALYTDNLERLQKYTYNDPIAHGLTHLGLSHSYREWNDLERALFHAETCLEYLEECGDTEYHVLAKMTMENVRRAQGDLEAQLALLYQARDLVDRYRVSHIVSAWVNASLARVQVEQGDLRPALRWIQQCGLTIHDRLSFDKEFEHMTLARVLTAQGEFGDSLFLLERLAQAAQTAQRIGRLIEILIQQAMTLAASGEKTAALAALQNAMQIARPERFKRVFLDEGPILADLLTLGNDSVIWESAQISEYASELLQASVQEKTK